MSEKNKYLPVNALIAMLCCLVMFTSSCMDEMIVENGRPGRVDSGVRVDVHFSLGGVMKGENEVVMRTSPPAPLRERGEMSHFGGDRVGEEETVVVSLGDGLAMVATLEVDHGVKLRMSTSTIDPGTVLRIVAYRDGTDFEGFADYTVSEGAETRNIEGGPLQVEPGEYRFVVYSFNSDGELPEPDAGETISNIDPANDLLWGCYPADDGLYEVKQGKTADISLDLFHVLSQLTVEASTAQLPGAYDITQIDQVTVRGKKVKLNVRDGSITASGDLIQELSFDLPPTGAPTVTSVPRTVYTGLAESSIIQIESLTLNNALTFPKLTAIFNKKMERGVSYLLRLNIRKDLGVAYDDSHNGLLMYVGAFWKAHQTGERLIRIERPTTGSHISMNDGAWMATVVTGNDWIVLDTEEPADPNIGWRTGADESQVHNGNDTIQGVSFDDLYPVNSTLTTVIGTMDAATPQIYFRIGLRSRYDPVPDRPARYGVILLTYFNNTRKHHIWIRQGEGEDYLFSNDDPTEPGSAIGIRTEAKRFSIYNLTAEILDVAPVDKPGAIPKVNPAIFTDYPSQAGAYFQWASNHAPIHRVAWNPHTPSLPVTLTQNQWQLAASGYWNTLYATHESCPSGYRRPNDGLTDQREYGNSVSVSELRQSLFAKPVTGVGYKETNTVWGCYADGFFDRRLITKSPGPEIREAVAFGTNDVAYIGRVFYNAIPGSDRYGASIFFPATGFRNTFGDLTFEVNAGGYWSSSCEDGYGRPLSIEKAAASPTKLSKAHGFSIRCVKE